MIDGSSNASPPAGVTTEGMTRADFLKVAGAAGLLVTASGSVITLLSGPAKAQAIGEFGPLFVEPVIYVPRSFAESGKRNREGDVKVRQPSTDIEADCFQGDNAEGETLKFCKPAAGQVGLLPDGRFLYANALEGTENQQFPFGTGDRSFQNDQSRVLKINYKKNTKSEVQEAAKPDGRRRGARVGDNSRRHGHRRPEKQQRRLFLLAPVPPSRRVRPDRRRHDILHGGWRLRDPGPEGLPVLRLQAGQMGPDQGHELRQVVSGGRPPRQR